ncbi:MAG TPA: hypothetical protein VF316_06890 [Polyangiaceae bacterium]
MSRSGILLGISLTAVACAQPAVSPPAAPSPARAAPATNPTTTGSALGASDRPARLAPGLDWKCPFPREADKAAVDDGAVLVIVTVAPTGDAVAVELLQDPGYGFGATARACFMAQKYLPALDAEGRSVQGTTRPIRLHFTR